MGKIQNRICRPSISVCMATYNGGKYIAEQIASILPQLEQEDELIISDDGSKDETFAIIEAFKDDRIKLYHNEGRHGFAGNFENAMRHSSGDILFFSDQDDIWMPDKVEKSMALMSKCDIMLHNAEVVDADGISKDFDYFSTVPSWHGFWKNLIRTRFLGCCMAFKRELLNDILPIPRLQRSHDNWAGMLALAMGYKVTFCNDCLIKYRRHGNNVTQSSGKSEKSLYDKIVRKRLVLLYYVTKRLIERKKHGKKIHI